MEKLKDCAISLFTLSDKDHMDPIEIQTGRFWLAGFEEPKLFNTKTNKPLETVLIRDERYFKHIFMRGLENRSAIDPETFCTTGFTCKVSSEISSFKHEDRIDIWHDRRAVTRLTFLNVEE